MRWLLRGAGALFLLVALAAGAVWWRLDALVKRAIESGASERLGVETTISTLLLRPLSGKLWLRELRIANPSGYDGSFLHVAEAHGELDVSTLRRDVIEVREITLTGVELTLEEKAGGSNYDAIVKNLHTRAAAAPAGAEKSGPSVRVHDLYVRDVTGHVRLGPAPALALEVPEIHLQQLGGPSGATTGEITAEVVEAILTTVATRAPGMPFHLAGRILTGLGLGGAVDVLRSAGERGLDALRSLLPGEPHEPR